MLEELICQSRFYDCPKLIRITLTYVHSCVSVRGPFGYIGEMLWFAVARIHGRWSLISLRRATASRINHTFFACGAEIGLTNRQIDARSVWWIIVTAWQATNIESNYGNAPAIYLHCWIMKTHRWHGKIPPRSSREWPIGSGTKPAERSR